MEQLHARGFPCTYGTVRSIVSGKQDARRGRETSQRFAPININDRVARLPKIDSVAMRELRTVYPGTVVPALEGDIILKSGIHSRKIGGRVLKGKWRGLPIYTLTLEERATCPVSCRHLRSCYGNRMLWAVRFEHGEQLELRLVQNVVALARQHAAGFVVRVHVLGDFYSVQYVNLWRAMLETIPQLNVFGYTARWDDVIGLALRDLVDDHWDRFAVRFSNAPSDEVPATISIELPVQRPPDTVICPEQMNQTESCASCGFCWHSRRRVAFLQH